MKAPTDPDANDPDEPTIEHTDPFGYHLPTGAQLRLVRDRLGLTRKETADAVDMHTKTIGRFERGEISPRVDQARQLIVFYRLELTRQAETNADDA